MDLKRILTQFLRSEGVEVSDKMIELALAQATRIASSDPGAKAVGTPTDARVLAASMMRSGSIAGGAYAMRSQASDSDDKFLT